MTFFKYLSITAAFLSFSGTVSAGEIGRFTTHLGVLLPASHASQGIDVSGVLIDARGYGPLHGAEISCPASRMGSGWMTGSCLVSDGSGSSGDLSWTCSGSTSACFGRALWHGKAGKWSMMDASASMMAKQGSSLEDGAIPLVLVMSFDYAEPSN